MRVLVSFPLGRSTTNPYLIQLSDQLAPEPVVLGFSWRRALTEQYDVFHAHWPEALLHGTTPARSRARRVLFRALLLRLRLARRQIAVVRTVHNLRSHELGSRVERRLLERFDETTSLWITLNPTTPTPAAAPVVTIEHGDYNDWFRGVPVPAQVSGRMVYFGLIRPYKGVPGLIQAFARLPAGPNGDALSLRVVGQPTSADIGAEVLLSATSDDRVKVSLGHASDADLAAEIGSAELVVLPYREMHNSGAALLALSLARPILVPSNAVTEALSVEVGPGWVHTYSAELTAEVLLAVLTRVRSLRRPGADERPDLSARAWPDIAAAHRRAYEQALRTVRPPASVPGTCVPEAAVPGAAVSAPPVPVGSGFGEQPVVGSESPVGGGQVAEHGSGGAVLPEGGQ
jgi:beta-1,4-mannosyltransferase